MNLAGMLPEGIEKYGAYEQFIYIENQRELVLKNTDIEGKARCIATGLKKLGVKRGDIVGVMLSNVPQVPEIMNGIKRMGGVFLPIIFMLTPSEILYVLDDSKCRVVITEEKLLSKVREAIRGIDHAVSVILIGRGEGENILSYDEFLAGGDGQGDVVDLEPDELAILMYTSGTTGFPKGVMLSHDNILTCMQNGLKVWPYYPTDRFLAVLPMNHIFGIFGFYEACVSGGSVVLLPRFDAAATLDIITRYGITVGGLVPTMIQMMMEKYDPGRHSFKTMRHMVSAGAPLAEETLRKAEELFGMDLYHGYGCTEAGPTIARQRKDRPLKFGSVGPPIPGIRLRLLNDAGEEVSRNHEGEIVVKGPGIMKGYWNKPRETADALKDGWLHTGDLGRLDDDGELYIVGRKKDLIIKGGENIDPGVSENVLYKHPAVLEVAVIGIPDARYGEEVGAAVALRPGMEVSEQELLDYLKANLHHFVAPKRIFLFDQLPKTSSGKISKKDIREAVKNKYL